MLTQLKMIISKSFPIFSIVKPFPSMVARVGLTPQPKGLTFQPLGLMIEPLLATAQPLGLMVQPKGLTLQPLGLMVEPKGLTLQPLGSTILPTPAMVARKGLIIQLLQKIHFINIPP